jgi:hypothetical protein
LLHELKAFEIDNTKNRPSAQLLLEVNKQLEMTGLYSPLEKVYIKMTKCSSDFVSYLVIITLQNLNRLAFGSNLLKYNKTNSVYAQAILKHRKTIIDTIHSNRYIDGHCYALGLITLMTQFYENNFIHDFIDMLGASLLEMMEYSLSSKHEMAIEIVNGLDLIESIAIMTNNSSAIERVIPKSLFDQRDFLLTVVTNMN